MPAEETRPEHDVGASGANELGELRVLLGRVLEIGVLNDHQIAGDGRKAAPQRRSLAAVARLAQQHEPAFLLQPLQDLRRAVGRPVVDDDQLDPQLDGEHATNDLLDRVALVEHRHDD